jgi:hypothetical protein
MMAQGRAELKQALADPVLAIACHEAARAVLGILLGVPFDCAEIGTGTAAGVGRLVVDGRRGPAAEEGMVCAMAGAGFDALLRPKAPLISIFARSCRCGFCKATWQPASICFGDGGWKGRKRVMPAFLRSRVLVRANSDAIVRVGRELAGRKVMPYDEILEAATRPEPVCPPGCQPQKAGSTGAGTGEDVRHDEYAARRHWDACLHEAAHAVMETRDGPGVSMVAVAGQPGDLEDGEGVCIGKEPLLSSLVAGNLAERLWGVGWYYRLGRMWNGAVGDFRTVAFLEARKRGSERVSVEDRRAATKTWRAEDRKLKSRILRDPTLELQIKAVAKALSLHGTLDGEEVRRIMEEALGIGSSRHAPAAAPAANHGG